MFENTMYFVVQPISGDPLGEATIGGTCVSVETFVPQKGFTASASLDPHKQCYVLIKELCGIRLADFAKTELFRITLMKLGASTLLSRIAFYTGQLGINAKITSVFALDLLKQIKLDFLLKNQGENFCQPRKLNKVMFLENVH